ncbi:MAG: UDP-N-acetylmuramoyl-tripeptide--D-alanyl-D-alanine ligase [Candidatus Caenarcaniphilales bacterium]|nr:UDP-N-acetylmuramoyl-tripeptide--D-alanyl-D-alanine ligase [Candidatus Caenarcaniphilales bacterium]
MSSLPESQSLPSAFEAFGLRSSQLLNWISPLPDWSFSTDSRHLKPGGWFLALQGEIFDGHQFCRQALEAGARGLILSQRLDDYPCPTIVVEDTLYAYQAIAQAQRRSLNPLVVGITGSNGKTTTKELASLVLAQKYRVSATSANENNEIGVPKSILEADPEAGLLVLEMGMRGLGQIAELVKIAEPTHTIITSIGTAHIGLLGSKEGIAQAKSEIFRTAKSPQITFLPFDEPLLKPWIAQKPDFVQVRFFGNYKIQSRYGGCSRFYYRNELYELRTLHQGIVQNVCAVIDLALELELSPDQIQAGLHLFKPPAGRGLWHQLSSGAFLIDDSYNANPDSVVALAQSLADQSGFKLLVLGEIAELGDLSEVLLTKLGADLRELVDLVLLVGTKLSPLSKALLDKAQTCENIDQAHEIILRQIEKKAPELIIAVKGSRVAKLDQLAARLID